MTVAFERDDLINMPESLRIQVLGFFFNRNGATDLAAKLAEPLALNAEPKFSDLLATRALREGQRLVVRNTEVPAAVVTGDAVVFRGSRFEHPKDLARAMRKRRRGRPPKMGPMVFLVNDDGSRTPLWDLLGAESVREQARHRAETDRSLQLVEALDRPLATCPRCDRPVRELSRFETETLLVQRFLCGHLVFQTKSKTPQ